MADYTGVPGTRGHQPPEAPLRTLAEILADVAGHNPAHGFNCVCMDSVVWEIRRIMGPLPPEPTRPESGDGDWARYFNAISRIRYVMRQAVKNL